jgi:hypothetical protein
MKIIINRVLICLIFFYCIYLIVLTLKAPFPEDKISTHITELKYIYLLSKLKNDSFYDLKELKPYGLDLNIAEKYQIVNSNNIFIVSKMFDSEYHPPFGVVPFLSVRGWPKQRIPSRKYGVTTNGYLFHQNQDGSIIYLGKTTTSEEFDSPNPQ